MAIPFGKHLMEAVMFQTNTTFEKLKIEIENHRFRDVEILGFADNGARVVFSYKRFIDDKRFVAGILLKKNGQFRSSDPRKKDPEGPSWIIGIPCDKKVMNKIFGKLTK